ncbi:MAG TPA: nuclear transport factor 2 family protein [Terracidiphilus sp.]
MSRFYPAVCAVLLVCPIALAQVPVRVASSATATSAAASTGSADVRQFQELEDRWSEAENKHDQYGLDNVLSPLLVNVAENGDITTHDQEVVETINNNDKLYYLSQKVIAVRRLGDVAVVNGTYLLRHHVNEKLVTDRGVFTHVFQQQRGAWRCVNAQRTLVTVNSDTRKGKEKVDKKTSSASLPFHIPLFTKGDKDTQ